MATLVESLTVSHGLITAGQSATVGTGLSLAAHTLTCTVTQYTDEAAQDAVGNILTDTATIDATYDDAGNTISFDVKANSITVAMMHAGATAVLFGRSTAGAGAGEEIAVGSGLSLAGGTLSATGGGGTVTSVGVGTNGPTFISMGFSPITTSGTIFQNWSGTTGDMIYCSATNVFSLLSGNVSSTLKFLSQVASGGTPGAPAWVTLTAGDIPSLDAAKITTGTLAAARVPSLDAITAPAADVSLNSHKITNLTDPTSAQDAATKAYADSLANGFDVKASARAATTAALAANTRTGNVLTASANGVLPAIDGVTLVVGDRLLVKNEATGANNGLYSVTSVGAVGAPWVLTRTTDADASAEVTAGLFLFVSEGTTNGDTGWVLTTNDAVTLNTTALTFSQFSGVGTYTGTGGVVVTGTSISVTYGTTAGTVAQGNDSRLSDARTPVGTALTSANIWVGSAGNVAAAVAMTGDVTITSAGVTAIGANKITDAMLRQGGACTVIGRSANTTGNVADIAVNADGKFLVRRAGALAGDVLLVADLPLINGFAGSDAHLGDQLLNYDTGTSANKILTLERLGGFIDPSTCQGRLTLTSGTAITTGDVTGAASVYFTPYSGNKVSLYDGTRWKLYALAEVTLALGTLVNGQAYDLFLYDNAGTLTLDAVEWHNATVTMTIATPAVVTWTGHGMSTGSIINFTNAGGALPTGVTANTTYWITVVDANTFKLSTSPANLAAGTFVATSGVQSGTHTGHEPTARQTALATQDSIYVKSGAAARRYVGSFRTTATTTTEDSQTKRFLWNYYNRCNRYLLKSLSAAHTYTTAAWRQWNADATAQIEFFIGVREDTPAVALGGSSYGAAGFLSFGLDTYLSGSSPSVRNNSATTTNEAGQWRSWESGIGYHYAAALENGATTWHSDSITLFGSLWA